MPLPPSLSIEQRRTALAKAAEARKERAELRENLKSGVLSLREVLASDSEAVLRMPVRTLLESLPGVGRARAHRLLAEMQIAATRRVRGLGPHQRDRLLARFEPQN